MITVTHNGTRHELDPQTIGAILELIAGDLDLPEEDFHQITIDSPLLRAEFFGKQLEGFSPAGVSCDQSLSGK